MTCRHWFRGDVVLPVFNHQMSNPTERAVFLQAIEEEDPADRRAYLDSACGDDAQLRRNVEALLQAHENPADLLDHPIGADQQRPVFNTETIVQHVDHIGMQIGPYKLMEQIGEGGFGLVFVAEQDQPVRRRVALKIVKPGVGSKEVIARFEAERQAVAMMNHPNIAQVFDAGVTADHRPYFVMELVRGLPITDFCDKQHLTVRDRLNLMVDVCLAVHHAHQKGVIHRDIKPSNVMVTLHDGRPIAKVIDFGVAKAIGQRLTDKTVYTRFFSMIGTPLYMSPEQAEMSGLDVDTRSDIYSLGVLLYELLAGATPFDRGRMESAGLDEMRRIIREEEPPRPSTRLSTMNRTMTTIADQRRVDPQRLASTLRGDLDWIVMMALEKDRARRYDTASSFAEDVRRYLRGESVQARPPSTMYRFRKFASRNRVAIVTVGLVAGSMILGTAASLWQMSRAIDERNAKDLAFREAMQAKVEAIQAKQQVEQFAEDLIRSNELVASGQSHVDAGRWQEAVDDFDAAVAMQPSYYFPRIQRAQLYTRLRLWPEAAKDYRVAMETGAATNQPQWWGTPALFCLVGYEDAFERLAQQNLRRLTKNSLSDWLTLRGLLVRPESSVIEDSDQLANLAERWLLELEFPIPPELRGPFAALGPERPRDEFGRMPLGDDTPLTVCRYTTGIAELRAGQFSLAVDLLNEAKDDQQWPAHFIVHAPLALAYHHQGDSTQATQTLQQSEKALRRILKLYQNQPDRPSVSPWFDLVEALVLHEEASVAITGSPSALQSEVQQMRKVASDLL